MMVDVTWMIVFLFVLKVCVCVKEGQQTVLLVMSLGVSICRWWIYFSVAGQTHTMSSTRHTDQEITLPRPTLPHPPQPYHHGGYLPAHHQHSLGRTKTTASGTPHFILLGLCIQSLSFVPHFSKHSLILYFVSPFIVIEINFFSSFPLCRHDHMRSIKIVFNLHKCHKLFN